jgi:heme o synthase
MRRTARRPIAAARIEPFPALVFGTTISFAGALYLALEVRLVASLLALLTLGGYLLLYTPLNRRTPMCTLVGACPGAMSVRIGYVAASGKIDSQACSALFRSLPLAVPSFHDDCVDVQRGLRARGISGLAFRRTERSLCDLPELRSFTAFLTPRYDSSGHRRIASRQFFRNSCS